MTGGMEVVICLRMMNNNSDNPQTHPYVRLQQHLDRQPIGFPATASGAEIRILKHIFTSKEAEVACCLSHRPEPLETIYGKAGHLVETLEGLEKHLAAMVKKGGIEIRKKEGKTLYGNAPLVVGMYELQLDRLTPEFIEDFESYSSDKKFGISFLGTRHPQMRTIPVQESIPLQKSVAPYDDIKRIIENSKGPFAVLECICRKKHALNGSSCEITHRKETCLALGDIVESVFEMGIGRSISKKDAMEILNQNQKDGLVLQPGNAQRPDFICSCCSCCCGMLSIQKSLPRPLSFWSSSYQAGIDADACNGCGICTKRCQVEAIALEPVPGAAKDSKKKQSAVLDNHRCIGCGLCVTSCPARAIVLNPVRMKNVYESVPPETRQDLYDKILQTKKDRLAKAKLLGRLASDMIQARDFRLLK